MVELLVELHHFLGPPILGAIEAVASAGKKTQLVGFDAGPDEVKAIVAGTELASVAQFPAKMGSDGAQAALDAITAGKTVKANMTRAQRWSPRTMPPTSSADTDWHWS